jgi:YrbI family 3-deoxy-D-manno-octulosonate 8-phosphate phosphatase
MPVDFKSIKLLLLDVDGVMTDGCIIYDNNGGETKAFDVKDGHGLKLIQRAGIQVGIITGRQSEIVNRRAAELGIELVYQGAKDKLIPFREILRKLALQAGGFCRNRGRCRGRGERIRPLGHQTCRRSWCGPGDM